MPGSALASWGLLFVLRGVLLKVVYTPLERLIDQRIWWKEALGLNKPRIWFVVDE